MNLPSWIALAQVSLKRALVRMLGISSAAGHVWLLAPGAWGWFLDGRVPCHPHRQQEKTHSLQHYRYDKPCFPYVLFLSWEFVSFDVEAMLGPLAGCHKTESWNCTAGRRWRLPRCGCNIAVVPPAVSRGSAK